MQFSLHQCIYEYFIHKFKPKKIEKYMKMMSEINIFEPKQIEKCVKN